MTIKRKLLAILAAGMLLLSVTGSINAAPNEEHANCVAVGATLNVRGVSASARLKAPQDIPRKYSLVAYDARTGCPA